MKKGSTSIDVILYKSKVLANGEHPLMIRVTRHRKVRYKSLGLSCSPKHWNFAKNELRKSHPEYNELQSYIENKKNEFNKVRTDFIIKEKQYSASSLIETAAGPAGAPMTVQGFFRETIDNLVLEKRIGNANVYRDTLRALTKFHGKRDLMFNEVDFRFLSRFTTFLRQNEVLDNSISVYFRTIRSLYNKAIKCQIAYQEDYPFSKFKISEHFKNQPSRRAISKEDIHRIKEVDLNIGTGIYEARQYFLFSYLARGINFVDIAYLKWSGLEGDRLIYERKKTGTSFTLKLQQPALDIIEYWRPLTETGGNEYIFPILSSKKHYTPTQIDNRVHKVLTQVNLNLKKLGELAGIKTKLTTYVARHTYATVLKKSGVSTTVISEALGHKSESITNVYLKSFENEVIENADKNLL